MPTSSSRGTRERYRETRIPVPDAARARAVVDSLADLGEDMDPRGPSHYRGYWGFIEPTARDLEALDDAGVPLLPGSDLAGPALYPGFSLHDELDRMVDWIGLSPEEVLLRARAINVLAP